MKQDRWEDVTAECELEWGNIGDDRHYIRIYHDGLCVALSERENVCITGGHTNTYRVAHEPLAGVSFRIERRVEVKQPFVLIYTEKFVASLDCKNMSKESVILHCVNKWDEVVSTTNATEDATHTTCPACAKYNSGGSIGKISCGDCPLLEDDRCCGGLMGKSATQVRDYIQGKLDEIRKPKAWVPKVGDRVRDSLGNEGVIIVFSERGQVVVDYKTVGIYGEDDDDLTLIEAAK